MALVLIVACSDDGGGVADAPTSAPVATSTGVGAQQPPGPMVTSTVAAAPQSGNGVGGCPADDPVECARRLQAESLRQLYALVPQERCNVSAPESPSPTARVACDGSAGWRMYEWSAGSTGAALLQRWSGTWVTVREAAVCADGVAWLNRRSLEQAGLPAELAARWGAPAARCGT